MNVFAIIDGRLQNRKQPRMITVMDPARRAERRAGLRAHLAELAAYAHDRGLDHLLVENLVTDREPSTMALIEDLLTERDVVHAPVRLCLDLGHPARGQGGRAADPGPVGPRPITT